MRNTLYLCGFMGAGKTTVGKALARKLHTAYLDTDSMIVEQEGMSVTDIFAQKGENYFRKRERQALRTAGASESAVVSTGGGCLCREENVREAKKHGLIVYLQTPFPVCYKRIKDKGTRPLVLTKTKEELRQLYDERNKQYLKAADIVIPGPNLVKHLVQEIMRKADVHPAEPKKEGKTDGNEA